MPPPALIVHGGAWDIPDDLLERCRLGCVRALDIGWAVLKESRGALDAVCAAVRALEDDTTFNAGAGSSANTGGWVENDASVMVSDGRAAGAVAALSGFRHPVDVARAVMERTPHVMLAGAGAGEFAKIQGFEPSLGAVPGPGAVTGSGDTVGAVAVDAKGVVAVATSTGGTPGKLPGRVGDSPILGAGTWASSAGGASATGWGEVIMRSLMASEAVRTLERGGDAMAGARTAREGVDRLEEQGAGVIVVDAEGRVGFAWSTPRMAYAWRVADGRSGAGPA